MNSTLSLTFALVLASFSVLRADSSTSIATKLDIVYKTTDQGPLRLDLHYPAEQKASDRFPLVVFTHGGGWTAGNKTIGERGVRFAGVSALTAQGFCVASIDYRLCSQDGQITIRDCIIDSKDALRFLAKNAKQFSVDAERVFTFGDSAGGHLAQMLLLSPPDSFLGDPTLADAKYRLIAGVSWYGPCDFEKNDLFIGPGRTDVQDRFGQRIARTFVDERTKLSAYREVSPVNYLNSSSPPLLMVQGDKDPTIPVHHARYMKERAIAVNAPVEILIVENSAHNWKPAGGELRPTMKEIVAKTATFMQIQLDNNSRK